MIWFAILAVLAGVLVSLSRQINGRLSVSTSAMESSFWNHLVGFGFLSLLALVGAGLFGGLFEGAPLQAPWWAYLGGPVGVVFIAAGSWLITRIGATRTAILIIAGQMVAGVAIDILSGASGDTLARVAGVSLILGGVLISQRR